MKAPAAATRNSRSLRSRQTNAETLIWRHLRDRQFHGLKFVRQFPVDGYIADFCCRQLRLIVEIDGGQHAAQRDLHGQRTGVLEARGYTVIRFWNNDVLTNLGGVLEMLGLYIERLNQQV